MKERLKAIKALTEAGFTLKRYGKKHDIFWNPATKILIPLKRHDFDQKDLEYIIKEINATKITKEEQ